MLEFLLCFMMSVACYIKNYPILFFYAYKNLYHTHNSPQSDLPARGNANGLHVDDLDDEEDENEEESDEFVSMSNVGKGSRLGGQQQIRTTDDSHIQSVLCMYFMIFPIIILMI